MNAGYTATSRDDQDLWIRDKLTSLSEWLEIETQLKLRGLTARPLRLSDYDSGYLEVLSQLTRVGEISRAEFEARFNQMHAINRVDEHYAIVVIEDTKTNRVIGASTLILEYKFIHQCAMRGRLEDVAVLETYRGKQIGELVVKIIVGLAREAYNCYKLSLDCTDDLKKFYSKNSFAYGSNMLAIRFKD
jgi:glucosamine-phosphate N-acetyltransferase